MYNSLREFKDALKYLKSAIKNIHLSKDPDLISSVFSNAGNYYQLTNQYTLSISYYNQALAIQKKSGDKNGQARSLDNIGSTYGLLGDLRRALEYALKALPLRQQSGDKNGETSTLNNIGASYDFLGDKLNALKYYEQALSLSKSTNNKSLEQKTLSNVGLVYASLGNHPKALDLFNQALILQRKLGQRRDEGWTLTQVATSYLYMDQKEKALDLFSQALRINQQTHEKRGEAMALNNMGKIYQTQGYYRKSLDYYNQVLPILRSIEDLRGESSTLTNIGTAYWALGNRTEPLKYYKKSLLLAKYSQDSMIEVGALNNIAKFWSDRNISKSDKTISTFIWKISISSVQSQRIDALKVDNKSFQTYTKSVEDYYRNLVSTLIAQERFTEALQILNILKQQELIDFVRKESKLTPTFQEAPDKTPRELNLFLEYEVLSKRLTKAKTAVTGLEHAQSQTSRHAIEVTQARQQLDIANTQFTRFLDSLPARFNKPIQDGEAKLAARKAKEFQEALTGLDHTLAIYLVPTEDALQLILVAPKQITTRTIKITQADLEKKLATFRAVLQNPKLDPRPLGKELYDILLKPIEAELTGIKTILWSLDGALRYIPVEALSPDGKGYLVERFAHARLTLTAKQRLTEKTKPTTTALVAGASLGKGGVSPLPGVPSEVNAIASILPGQTLLDPTFTKASFLASLKKGYPLVHIATHFELGEQASQSALLLGDGTRLSLLELLEGGNAFVGVEQVTLSACSTAVGEGSGREVDSLAKVAELLGARSVLASLWPVNDSSTSVLMQRFYTLLKSEPGLGRGECLRKAQRELLSGKASSVGAARGPVAATGGKPPATVPAFIPYPDAPCAHPYYWAPFILIGNTR